MERLSYSVSDQYRNFHVCFIIALLKIGTLAVDIPISFLATVLQAKTAKLIRNGQKSNPAVWLVSYD